MNMERGRRKRRKESAWDTGQEHRVMEGQRKSERAYFLELKGNGSNGEEADSINGDS